MKTDVYSNRLSDLSQLHTTTHGIRR